MTRFIDLIHIHISGGIIQEKHFVSTIPKLKSYPRNARQRISAEISTSDGGKHVIFLYKKLLIFSHNPHVFWFCI